MGNRNILNLIELLTCVIYIRERLFFNWHNTMVYNINQCKIRLQKTRVDPSKTSNYLVASEIGEETSCTIHIPNGKKIYILYNYSNHVTQQLTHHNIKATFVKTIINKDQGGRYILFKSWN